MGTSNNAPRGSRRIIGTAATVVLALLLAGCGSNAEQGQAQQDSSAKEPSTSDQRESGSDDESEQEAPQASKAETAWMDEYCEGMAKVTNAASDIPQTDSEDPDELKGAMSELLGNIIEGDRDFLADLDDMAASPIDGGDEFIDSAKDSYQELYDTVKEAKSDLDETSPDDEKEAAEQVQAAQQDIQQVDLQAPLEKLESNDELVGAFEQAPECREMIESAQQDQPAPGGN